MATNIFSISTKRSFVEKNGYTRPADAAGLKNILRSQRTQEDLFGQKMPKKHQDPHTLQSWVNTRLDIELGYITQLCELKDLLHDMQKAEEAKRTTKSEATTAPQA